MNRKTFLSILLVLVIVLTSCTTAISTTESTATSVSQSGTEISLATKLALGTIQLDQTDYGVDAKQAAELLTLWKAARALSQSETTAQLEVNALLKQIQNTLTTEQLAALEDMNLSSQDVSTVVGMLGLSIVVGGSGSGETVAVQAGSQGGNMGAGPMPGSGDMPVDQIMGSEVQPATSTGSNISAGAMLEIDSALLDGIIQFLEARVSK